MSTAQMSPQGTNRFVRPDSTARSVPASGHISDKQVAEIVGRLQRRYPRERVSAAELERRVRASYRLFDAARIRTFVGVFVERLVRRSIDQVPLDVPTAPPVAVGRLPTGCR